MSITAKRESRPRSAPSRVAPSPTAHGGAQQRISSAPVTTSPPAPVRPTKMRRRPALIGLGVALVALGALAMVYITSTLGQTRQVLAVTGTVQRGAVIEAKNLTVVDLPTGPTSLKYVTADQLSEIAGQLATVELSPGSLLTAQAFAASLTPGAGKSVVGVALSSSQMPTAALRSGDKVRIVETPSAGGEPPESEPLSIPATIISTKVSALGDVTIVNVEVEYDKAGGLAARAATGRVALVLDTAQG